MVPVALLCGGLASLPRGSPARQSRTPRPLPAIRSFGTRPNLHVRKRSPLGPQEGGGMSRLNTKLEGRFLQCRNRTLVSWSPSCRLFNDAELDHIASHCRMKN